MPNSDQSVIAQVSAELGRYVYLLVDPRNSVPFYVGKGQGVRFLEHGKAVPEDLSTEEGPKAQTIHEIRNAHLEPEIWIVRYALSAAEYTAVEAALIDLLQSFPINPQSEGPRRPFTARPQLTNLRRESAAGHGMVFLDHLVSEFAAPDLEDQTPMLLITLGDWVDLDQEEIAGKKTRNGAGFKIEWHNPERRNASFEEMGVGVSAWWVLSEKNVRQKQIEHVVALYRGVTRGLFRIDHTSWDVNSDGRRAFDLTPLTSGKLFESTVGPHGHRVRGRARGSQNPIYYWPR